MKLLIAPDSFKGTMDASEVSQIIAEAIKGRHPGYEVHTLPLADGGEGSIDVLAASRELQKRELTVQDPLFRPIKSYYYYDAPNKTAYIEMARASGLTLLKQKELHAIETTTIGTGQLIKDALMQGARRVVIFIGGSATNDAGTGMAEALGITFRNRYRQKLLPVGRNLKYIEEIEDYRVMPEINDTEFIVATDVNNPLYGPQGAAYIYGAQKGATEAELRRLDEGLRHFAEKVKARYHLHLQNMAGSGAAGGLGGGCAAFLGASMRSGADVIFQALDFEQQVQWADLIISGEGKIDRQSLYAKLLAKVAAVARQAHVPIWAVCGFSNCNKDELKTLGIEKLFALAETKDEIEKAMEQSSAILKEKAAELAEAL